MSSGRSRRKAGISAQGIGLRLHHDHGGSVDRIALDCGQRFVGPVESERSYLRLQLDLGGNSQESWSCLATVRIWRSPGRSRTPGFYRDMMGFKPHRRLPLRGQARLPRACARTGRRWRYCTARQHYPLPFRIKHATAEILRWYRRGCSTHVATASQMQVRPQRSLRMKLQRIVLLTDNPRSRVAYCCLLASAIN